MKKPLLFIFSLLCAGSYAQEHFTGLSTSRRVGVVNGFVNPAEYANIATHFEVNVFNFSMNVANNKISFGDIVSGDDFDNLIFQPGEPTNLRLDAQILGPGLAMKVNKWAFAITTAANVKADMVDVDVALGNAVTNGNLPGIIATYDINANNNQRVSALSWGEIGLSGAREIFSNEEHKITGGVTFKLLFPGSYANVAIEGFTGEIDNIADQVYLNDAYARVNVTYSGSLENDFTDSSNFTKFFAGGLNGFGADLGVNYQWKNPADNTVKLNAGISVRNLGKMTFKDDNNESNQYILDVPDNANPADGLHLNQFEDAESIRDIENILNTSPYFNQFSSNRDFKVNMPTMFTAYADFNLIGGLYLSAYTQQKMNEDNKNEQITVQNIVSATPRYSTKWFEAYVPLSHNEVSGFTAGIGFRVGGFFIGSGSILSAAISDTHQADAYFGFRFGI